MGHSSIGTLLFLCACLSTCAGYKFLLTVPKEAYYDSDLVASVSAFGIAPTQKENITLEYRGYRDNSKILNSTVLEFTSDGSKDWKVFFSWDHIQKLDEIGVEIRMISNFDEVRKHLSFTQNFGYIFIQTDKPVYTPLQTVKFRVIAVDEYQRLAKYYIKISVRNHKQIVVDQMRYTAEEAFSAQEFKLPKDTPSGKWTITANFEGVDLTPSASHTAEFEIMEYVLPRFTSIVSIDPDVITNGTQWVTINVTSRYVYGRPVLGTVDLRLGIWDPSATKMLPVHITKLLQNGQFSEDIRVGQLFPTNLSFTRNNRLYVKATVTESASQESYEYVDTSTFIAHPYYLVDFKLSKKYFKPGFPYTFQAQASAQNGRPASWIGLYVLHIFLNVQYERIGGNSSYYELNDQGEMKTDFDIPENTYKILFSTIVTDPKATAFERFTLEVLKYDSQNNQYIHISLPTPIKKYQNGQLLLRYTKPKQPDNGEIYRPDIISVLVLARGHIIYTTTSSRNLQGFSNVPLPSRLYTEIAPNMRIVAFYNDNSRMSDYIIDSLFVDTPDVCLEEVSLSTSGDMHISNSLYKPKDIYHLEVDGTANMNVGFVAVDKAVFLVNNKPTLTRNLMFDQFSSHDKGIGSGDGSDLKEVLENSGLFHLSMESESTSNIGLEPAIKADNVHSDMFVGTRSAMRVPFPQREREKPTAHATPPQTVRNYFPESWFFEEMKLPQSGHMSLNLTLPDSITTWSFMAVGISSKRGICVSPPLEQPVQKLFFADVRLPFKATRLEEVKVKIAVYNYQQYAIEVKVVVTGEEGLCFSANTARGNSQNSTIFNMTIPANQAKGETVKVIPLRNGDLTLNVDLRNTMESDVVQKKLHVIAEGRRIQKSITFVLDPEAKHATFRPSKKNITRLHESSTINNVFDLKNKEQQTMIDLTLPSNIIRGTESCKISAFGDLMGDIITHAVVESRNLINTPLMNAEEILGDLAPTTHALLSARRLGLMDKKLTKRANNFVKHSVAKLVNYKIDNSGFALTPKSHSSTWLTAFVLKTLCHAKPLAFIDQEKLIDEGFVWLLNQMRSNGTLEDQAPRFNKTTFLEYDILLSAEVFIAILECKKSDKEQHLELQGFLSTYLEGTIDQIKDPMVLAKVTYALMMFDPSSGEVQNAVKRLQIAKRKNTQGHNYWSKLEVSDEDKCTPIWFRTSVHASAIEATAYALMVFLQHRNGGINTDAIADWLVGQRKYNGAFIGAMDSTAAIQALSEYSFQKHGSEVDLHCNVSSDKLKDYFYSFAFTEKNAIHHQSHNNVPLGHVLNVLTHGHGLGQMQVNVEYNIPIDKNKNCPFMITIDINKTMVNWAVDMQSNPLCSSCGIGCPQPAPQPAPQPNNAVFSEPLVRPTNKTIAAKLTIRIKSRRRLPGNETRGKKVRDKKQPRIKRIKPKSEKKRKTLKPDVPHRNRRQTEHTASRKSICVHFCIKHMLRGPSEPIEVRIAMLTGYKPVKIDIEKMTDLPYVEHVDYDNDNEILKVQFSQISCTEKTCVTFRAVDEEDAERLSPANVEVIQRGTAEPQCIMQYYALDDKESLQVFCADFSQINRGECRCYSGLCSVCKPAVNVKLNLHDVKLLTCNKPVVYQLQIANVINMGNWVEIDSKVISLNRTGTDNITSGSIIKMMTPTSCMCPLLYYRNNAEKFYMISADMEKLVDSNGTYVYRYLLDEQSTIIRVAEPGITSPSQPSVDHYYLQNALKDNTCLN